MTTMRVPVEEQMALLMRGVEYGDANLRQTMAQELRERLTEDRPLRVYCGFDPTSTDLTLGNLVPMLKLRQFQQLGHEVTFLIGTMTATIGDPTGRSAARPMQTAEEVEQKAETWLGQAFRVLDPKLTLVRRNGDWLAPLNLTDLVQLAANFTVSQFLAHDTFRQRHEENVPIHLHEFIYALMQGYDAFAMNTDVQVGGTDQLFNIMAGRTIQRANGQKPQIALCLPLLTGTDGRLKMSKSVGNYIGLDDGPTDMFGKVMSVPDALVPQYFTLLTDVSVADVAAMARDVESKTVNPMDLKKRLGRAIVALLYDETAAAAAQSEFERVFQRREEPQLGIEAVAHQVKGAFATLGGSPKFVDITNGKTLLIPSSGPAGIDWPPGWARTNGPGYNLGRILVDAGLVPSTSEARRLIRQGAITLDGVKLGDENLTELQLSRNSTVRVGRYRFLWIVHS